MDYRNDGISESNILQNEFTSYLMICLQGRKRRYYKQKQKYACELPLNGYEEKLSIDSIENSMGHMPVLQQIEDEGLFQLLLHSTEKELKVLLMRILDERTFVDIAQELNLNQNTAKTIYSRLMKKIKNEKKGGSDSNEF